MPLLCHIFSVHLPASWSSLDKKKENYIPETEYFPLVHVCNSGIYNLFFLLTASHILFLPKFHRIFLLFLSGDLEYTLFHQYSQGIPLCTFHTGNNDKKALLTSLYLRYLFRTFLEIHTDSGRRDNGYMLLLYCYSSFFSSCT